MNTSNNARYFIVRYLRCSTYNNDMKIMGFQLDRFLKTSRSKFIGTKGLERSKKVPIKF